MSLRGHARLPAGSATEESRASVLRPVPDDATLAAVRLAASALARQGGAGLDRATIVAAASGAALHVSVLAAGPAEPVIAVVHPAAASSTPGRDPVFDALTPREREVAAQVAAGLSNAEIAAALCVSLSTVKDHVHRILAKTALPRRTAICSAWHD
jgi:DNA-binding NarL/FixJ family response regulator